MEDLTWATTEAAADRACISPASSADRILDRGGRRFFLFYSPDTWALDVIGVLRNLELYQTLFSISGS
jgi:hypothetical protein